MSEHERDRVATGTSTATVVPQAIINARFATKKIPALLYFCAFYIIKKYNFRQSDEIVKKACIRRVIVLYCTWRIFSLFTNARKECKSQKQKNITALSEVQRCTYTITADTVEETFLFTQNAKEKHWEELP